jgi:xanthine dehydrogenase YagS FAD-binding subunit
MSLKSFAYMRATGLDEAIASVGVADGNGEARFLAGGTDLLTLMKAEIANPGRLIDIKRIPELSRAIEVTADGATLGALTTLAQIETSEEIRQSYAVLAEAAALAATPQLRNMATIGGNLLQRPRCWYFRNPHIDCWLKGGADCPARDGENQLHAIFDESPCVAVHPSDPAAALLSLDATIDIRGTAGERTIPLAELFAPPTAERRREHVLGDDEVVVAIRLPAPLPGTRGTYLKAMDRKVWAFAVVGVAVVVRMDGNNIEDVRLVLSGVATVPRRVPEAEQALIGQEPTADLFERAAEIAVSGNRPLARNGYKVSLVKTLVVRALRDVMAPESSDSR